MATFVVAFFALRIRTGHPALALHPDAIAMLAERSGGARYALRRLIEHGVFVARRDSSHVITPAHVEAAWLAYQQTTQADDAPPSVAGEISSGETAASGTAAGKSAAGSAVAQAAVVQAAVSPAVPEALRYDAPGGFLCAPASQRLPPPSAFILASRKWHRLRMALAGAACGMAALWVGARIGLAVQPARHLPAAQLAAATRGAGVVADARPGIVAAVPAPTAASPSLTSGPPPAPEPPRPEAALAAPPLLGAMAAPAPAPGLSVRQAELASAAPADASLAGAPPAAVPSAAALPAAAAPPAGAAPVDVPSAAALPAAVAPPDAGTLPVGEMPRVYVVYPRGNAEAALHAAQTVRALRAARYDVADPQQVAEAPVHDADVGYFFVEDAVSAAAIAERLGGHARLIARASGAPPRPGTIQIGLPPRVPVTRLSDDGDGGKT